jgi:hypothetical protein
MFNKYGMWEPEWELDSGCVHEWEKIVLIRSVCYDCKKCGKKREDWEREEKERQISRRTEYDFFD